MPTTIRLMPPANSSLQNPITVNGRTYVCASGGTIDVPDFDAYLLQANGWTPAAGGGTGSVRPTAMPNGQPLKRGTTFNDTTIGKIIMWDGAVWRDHTTGALV
jgi:hypothetical protein